MRCLIVWNSSIWVHESLCLHFSCLESILWVTWDGEAKDSAITVRNMSGIEHHLNSRSIKYGHARLFGVLNIHVHVFSGPPSLSLVYTHERINRYATHRQSDAIICEVPLQFTWVDKGGCYWFSSPEGESNLSDRWGIKQTGSQEKQSCGGRTGGHVFMDGGVREEPHYHASVSDFRHSSWCV